MSLIDELQNAWNIAADLATDKRELERLCGNAKIEIESLQAKLEFWEAIIAADGALITGLKNDLAEVNKRSEVKLNAFMPDAFMWEQQFLTEQWRRAISLVKPKECGDVRNIIPLIDIGVVILLSKQLSEANATLESQAAQDEQEKPIDLSTCPKCGGDADNGHDRCYPPSPYNCTKCMKEETKP